MHILTVIPLWCHARLGWRHCDVTGHLACPQRCYGDLFPRRPRCAGFEHVQNLAATSVTFETLLRSAALPRSSMRSHNEPAAISGDLADFADRSEVAILCDWGINRHPFADDTFKHIFTNENVRISINTSLTFVPKGLINNLPALVQIMDWRPPGTKPLSEPMMVWLLTHICVTRPQWVNINFECLFHGQIFSQKYNETTTVSKSGSNIW